MSRKKTIEIDFPPKSAVRWKDTPRGAGEIMKILEARRDDMATFIHEMSQFQESFLSIPRETEDARMPRWTQNWFPPLDGMSSFTMVAGKSPDWVIEIGSGNSTKFMGLARDRHSPATRIMSIDPFPREEIDALCDVVHRVGLEDVDLSIFDTLKAGDVLFFDGSHRSFQNSDVTVFFIDVLPRLADGVIVGIHDIFWPMDYPESWLERYYNEQYMLGAYMVPFGTHFPALFSSSFAWRHMQDSLEAAFSDTFMKHPGRRLSGGCLWFEKKSFDALRFA